MKVVKLMAISLVIMLIGCSQISEVTADKTTINVDDTEYLGVIHNGLGYLEVTDFVELVNRINESEHWIDEMMLEDFDEKSQELNFKLLANKNNFMMEFENVVSWGRYKIKNTIVEGENLQVNLSLKSHLLHPIRLKEQVYLPVELINYEIFKDNLKLYRTEQNTYITMSFRSTDFYSQDVFIDPSKHYDVDYNLSYKALIDYFSETTSKEINVDDEIDDYSSYCVKLHELSSALKDYHYGFTIDENLFNEEDLRSAERKLITEDIEFSPWIKRFPYTYEESKTDALSWHKLNDDVLYVDSYSFLEDYVLYTSLTNKLVVELAESDYSKVIIDLRENSGGYGFNTLTLFNVIADETYQIKIANLYNDEVYSTHTYTMTKKGKHKKDYEIILLLSEDSASASIVFANIVKDNMDATIIGREPLYKKAEHTSIIQSLEGMILTKSETSYMELTSDNVRFDDVILVDKIMSDDEIKEYLNQYN